MVGSPVGAGPATLSGRRLLSGPPRFHTVPVRNPVAYGGGGSSVPSTASGLHSAEQLPLRAAAQRRRLGPRRVRLLSPRSHFLMRRHTATARPDWPKIVESQGMYYHTADGVPYWDESVYYEFRAAEIDVLEKATYALNDMCLAAVERVLAENLLDRFLIPPEFQPYIRDSWELDEPTLYGRFDLAYDGSEPPKLLEYNADTPTALLESAVIQWFWLKDVFPSSDQFNSIHERLLEAWQSLRGRLPQRVYFASLADCVEDYMTVSYLRDVAMQAGFDTAHAQHRGHRLERRPAGIHRPQENADRVLLQALSLGMDAARRVRLALVPGAAARWIEPPWKAILSNKAILPILWEMFPESPYLLPASFAPLARRPFRAEADLRPRGGQHPGLRAWAARGEDRRPLRRSDHLSGSRLRCRALTASIMASSGVGSSTAGPAASASARTRARSPAISAASCRTSSDGRGGGRQVILFAHDPWGRVFCGCENVAASPCLIETYVVGSR